ncbi:hypothetical protein KGO06_02355 [Patescibacteria group bacterium]|nr:hypothetical protein [Patescibacteria group bacterium]
MEQPVVYTSWQDTETEFVHKTSTWYWSIGILSIGSATAAFIIGNFLFGIILLLAGGTVTLAGSRRPALHLFKITDRGIHVGDQVFEFPAIANFAIDDHTTGGTPTMLQFSLNKGLVKVVTVPLRRADFRAVRTALKNHNIEEVESLNSFSARLADWIGIG